MYKVLVSLLLVTLGPEGSDALAKGTVTMDAAGTMSSSSGQKAVPVYASTVYRPITSVSPRRRLAVYRPVTSSSSSSYKPVTVSSSGTTPSTASATSASSSAKSAAAANAAPAAIANANAASAVGIVQLGLTLDSFIISEAWNLVTMPFSIPECIECLEQADRRVSGKEEECLGWNAEASAKMGIALGAVLKHSYLAETLPISSIASASASISFQAHALIQKEREAMSRARREECATNVDMNCINPDDDPPHCWVCNCMANLIQACSGVDDSCFKVKMCDHSMVEQSWKLAHCSGNFENNPGCTKSSLLIQGKLKGQHQTKGLVRRSSSGSVDEKKTSVSPESAALIERSSGGKTEAKALDESLSDKCAPDGR